MTENRNVSRWPVRMGSKSLNAMSTWVVRVPTEVKALTSRMDRPMGARRDAWCTAAQPPATQDLNGNGVIDLTEIIPWVDCM